MTKKKCKFVRYTLTCIIDVKAANPDEFDYVSEVVNKMREMGSGEVTSVEMVEKEEE